MQWNTTADRHVWASVAVQAQTAFPELTNADWHATVGDRSTFVALVAERRGIDEASAERLVAGFEENGTRFVY